MTKKLPEILTRCGFRCDLCPAYKVNIKIANRQEKLDLSDGWFKYFGFRIPAEEIYCDGCLSDDKTKPKLLDKSCIIRPCTIKKGFENCTQCKEYICDKLKTRIIIYEEIFEKNNNKIPRFDRSNYIKPFENKERLDVIRKNISDSPSRLFNKFIIPDEKSMMEFIGSDMRRLWAKLNDYINSNFKVKREINYFGKKYGWCIKYKKTSKTFCVLFPEQGSFTFLIVLGRKELEKINDMKSDLSAEVIKTINNTHQYHDGKWVYIRLKDDNFINDIKNIIKVK